MGAIIVVSFNKSSTETQEAFEEKFRKVFDQFADPPKGLSFRGTQIDNLLPLFPANLIHLNLANCIKISDEIIAKLPRGLRFLNLNNCTSITNEGTIFQVVGLIFL